MNTASDGLKPLLGMNRVVELTGISRGHIYKLIRKGLFPPPIRISGHKIAWKHDDISLFLEKGIEYKSFSPDMQ